MVNDHTHVIMMQRTMFSRFLAAGCQWAADVGTSGWWNACSI